MKETEPFLFSKETITYPSMDCSLEEKSKLILQVLKSNYLYWHIKRKIKAELIKSKYLLPNIENDKSLNNNKHLQNNNLQNITLPKQQQQNRNSQNGNNIVTKNSIFQILNENYSLELENEIFKIHQEAERNLKKLFIVKNDILLPIPSLPYLDEKIDVIYNCRLQWYEFLKDQLTNISLQLNKPFLTTIKNVTNNNLVTTTVTNNNSVTNNVTNTSQQNLPKYTGVYDCKKLYETICNITNPNSSDFINNANWNEIKLELKTPTIKELRILFKELDPEYCQVGLDDFIDENFTIEILNLAKNAEKNLKLIFQLAKKGIPISMRCSIWCKILNIDLQQNLQNNNTQNNNLQNNLQKVSENEQFYFETLKKENLISLIDEMIVNDIKKTMDDENYFVFEDFLIEIMSVFYKDTFIHTNMEILPIYLYGMNENNKIVTIFPTNGVIPFEGISYLCSPCCYLSNNVTIIYYIFRNLYTRYFCKLNTISSHPESILSLCKLFEDLLQDKDPQLFYHLLQLNIKPLDISYKWIFYAFSGYLKVDQLLLLWDRIIGFNNLFLVPVLAVAIFLFRSKCLLKMTDRQEIFDIFSDFTVIQVIPLLQLFLFN
ncbi:hypothetical protein ABK040_002720 [Willaertia magna]